MKQTTLCYVLCDTSSVTCNVPQSVRCLEASLTWLGEWTAAAATDARGLRDQATLWTETDELRVCPGSYPGHTRQITSKYCTL